ncbi:MAG: substrate-binding domain-containing protein, partial [Kiritimatiellae bacterium]|nr:substrate-binding domain-containing protein [Kiritimatiellia bacterium]
MNHAAKPMSRASGGAKAVLMLSVKGDTFAQAGFAAARREALRRRWEFFSAEVFRDSDGTMHLLRSSRGADSVADLMSLLKPDGLVVWGSVAFSVPEVRRAADAGLPVVFVNPMREDSSFDAEGGVCVCCDPESIALIASRALIFSTGCGDFAYVPHSGDASWSRERGDAFARCIAVAGKRFHRYVRPPDGAPGAADALGRWLEALPKPCGVFAANDIVGEEILGVCARLGIAVPDEVAVIGVDN